MVAFGADAPLLSNKEDYPWYNSAAYAHSPTSIQTLQSSVVCDCVTVELSDDEMIAVDRNADNRQWTDGRRALLLCLVGAGGVQVPQICTGWRSGR